jgi:hypothetical protein
MWIFDSFPLACVPDRHQWIEHFSSLLIGPRSRHYLQCHRLELCSVLVVQFHFDRFCWSALKLEPSTVAAWPFNCLCQHNEDIVGISLSLVKNNIYYFTPNPVATWSSRSAEDNQKTRWFCGRSSALRFNPKGLKSCHRYLICHRVAPAHSDYIMTDQPI